VRPIPCALRGKPTGGHSLRCVLQPGGGVSWLHSEPVVQRQLPPISRLHAAVSGVLAHDSQVLSDEPRLLAHDSQVLPDVSGVLPDVSGIFPDVSGVLADVTCVLADLAGVLADVTCVLADLAGVLTGVTCVLADVSGVLTDVSRLLSDEPCILAEPIGQQRVQRQRIRHRRQGERRPSVTCLQRLDLCLVLSDAVLAVFVCALLAHLPCIQCLSLCPR
jgi:hypothetical protein